MTIPTSDASKANFLARLAKDCKAIAYEASHCSDMLFMPFPGYPYYTKYVINEKSQYFLGFAGHCRALKMEILAPEDFSVCIILPAVGLILTVSGATSLLSIRLSCHDAQIPEIVGHIGENSMFTIQLWLADSGGCFASINGLGAQRLPVDALLLDDLSIKCLKGSIEMVYSQSVPDSYSLPCFYSLGPFDKRIQISSVFPSVVLKWEKNTKYLYHLCLRIWIYNKILRDEHGHSDLDLLICRSAEVIFNSICSWPHWRPSAGPNPEDGPWERNNWSNGYIPGLLSVINGLYGFAPLDQFMNLLYTKGTRYLCTQPDSSASAASFPSELHWTRRSTNHGIVIYLTYLFGSWQLPMSPINRRVESNAYSLLNKALSDGSYLEGNSYMQFVIIELIPLYVCSFLRGKLFFDAFLSRLRFLQSLRRYVEYSSDSREELFSDFGDCGIDSWLPPVKRFISSIPVVGGRNSNVSALQYEGTDSPLDSDGVTFLASLLPVYTYPRSQGISYFLSTKNGLLGIKKIRGKEQIMNLFALCSTAHRTHNKDHDCLSFNLEISGEVIVMEKRGKSKSQSDHSGIIALDDVDEYDHRRISCGLYGSLDAFGRPRNRILSGSVIHVKPSQARVFTSGIIQGFSMFMLKSPQMFFFKKAYAVRTAIRLLLIDSAHDSGLHLIVVDIVIPSATASKARFFSHLLSPSPLVRNELKPACGNGVVPLSSRIALHAYSSTSMSRVDRSDGISASLIRMERSSGCFASCYGFFSIPDDGAVAVSANVRLVGSGSSREAFSIEGYGNISVPAVVDLALGKGISGQPGLERQ